jgi:hypothetical protein
MKKYRSIHDIPPSYDGVNMSWIRANRKKREGWGKWHPADESLTPSARHNTRKRRKLEREKAAQKMKEILFPTESENPNE